MSEPTEADKIVNTYAKLTRKHREQIDDLQAEVTRLRGCLTKANDGFEEYERKYYLEMNAKEDAEQRAERAELLVRLVALGEVIFNRTTDTVFTSNDELPYDPSQWTDEQWERLAALEKGGEG